MKNKKSESEKLKAEVERLKKELKKRKKYGLVWEEKPEEVVEMCKEKLPVLKEVKNKEIITDKDKPVNLLIEGDNYHALSVLNYTHAKKVDVIYIDPPYNRGAGGSSDFKYNDKFVEKEDAYRHSKWLGFMKSRLILAKSILKDTGVVFISIDENEFAQLKLLCDEIFGENNFLGNLIWKRRGGIGSFAEKYLTQNHEYVIVYKKQNGFLLHNILGEKRKKEFKYKDEKGYYRWIGLVGPSQQTKERRPNLDYGILYDEQNNKIVGFVNRNSKKDFFDKNYSNKIKEIWLPGKATWLIGKDGIKKFYNRGLINVFKGNGGYSLRIKNYLYDSDGKIRGTILKSILSDNDVYIGMNSEGTSQIKEILYPKDFSNMKPKPLSLIKFLLSTRADKNSVVMDFFAGTGTTAHAVLGLNKEDGGNRQFILCTNNENNICTDVCYPRIKKVIEGYKNLKGEKVEGLGGNLKYFKTDFVGYNESTDKNKIKLTRQATEMICVKEGTFEKVVDNGRFKIFKNSSHYTGIIWDQTAIPAFKKAIKNIKGKFSVYVFSLGDETFNEEFEDIKQKVQLSPIPEAILRVYRRIFK
jgi:adenine-specific DNA-methyltransferase